MKTPLYLLLCAVASLVISCRKDKSHEDIKAFDDRQIQEYIRDNSLSGMKRDTSNGDTSGIYYQIITPGSGSVMEYFNKVSYAYTMKTFDGGYSSTDTITNHINTYVGYFSPKGVQLALKFILKRKGGKIRLLVPSRLGYGNSGVSSGSSTINGNQCLDYTITVVDQQAAYDEISIKNYIKKYNLSGYTRTVSGLYYKVTKAGTGTVPVTMNSVVGVQYTGYLLNQTVFDQANTSDGTAASTLSLYNVVTGWQQGLPYITAGGKINLIMPSALGYEDSGSRAVPPFSCLRFDINLISVEN